MNYTDISACKVFSAEVEKRYFVPKEGSVRYGWSVGICVILPKLFLCNVY